MTRPAQLSYLKARRDAARARGDCLRCQRRPGRVVNGKTQSICDHCADRYQYVAARYVPLDRMLEQVTVRILRALRWFDGVRASDLFDALGIDGREDRKRWSVSIKYLHGLGLVAQSEAWGLYRITPAGREWLAKQLRRADPGVATDAEAA